MHPDQDAGGQRARGATGPARRGIRRRDRTGQRGHGESQGPQGRHHARRPQGRRELAGRHGRLHRRSRARPLRGPAHAAGRRPAAARRPDLPQRRRPCGGAGHSGTVRRRVPHQRVDPRTRHGAIASRHRRRQLHRAGVRADVPPLRGPGDRRRAGSAAGSARGRGCLRHHQGDPGGRRHRRCPRRRRYPDRQARRSRLRTDARRRCRPDRRAAICCWRWAGDPTPTIWVCDAAGVQTDARGYIVVDDQLQDQRRPHLGDGRLQRQGRVHPHVVQRLRDRRRQPARRRPAPGERPHHHLCALHRPAAGPRRHDRRPGPRVGPQGAGRQAADDQGRQSGGKG